MLTLRVALAASALCILCASAQAAPAPQSWAQTRSDVAPDPGVLFGKLSNGMLYAIVRNDTPAHQTSIRLRIGSGSMEERDDQQGLAHFLEHMAFKGSTHVPAGEMIKLLERHGLAFGPDTNAQTGFDDTVFMLDLPESDPETLNLGLMLMRETASELTLSQAAMNPERGVVLSEERLRDTPDFESLKKRLIFDFPGQLAPHRLPIGLVDILKTAPVSLIRQYYAANYRPDRAQLIVVGDIDPKAVEADIKSMFGDWKPVGPPTAEPDYGVLAPRGPQTQLIVQPGAHPDLSVSWLKPFRKEVESEAKDRRIRIEDIAMAVLNRRLERLAQGEDAPFIGAEGEVGDQLRSARVATLSILPKTGAWREGLAAVLHTERRAVDFGVAQSEVDRELVEARARLQTAADAAATRRTPDLAQEIVSTLDDDEVVTSPAQDLARFDRDVKGLTAADVTAALKTIFSGQGPILSFTSPTPIVGGEAALKAAFASDLTDAVGAGAVASAKAWPYANFGAPGRVVARRQVADLGVTFVRVANGVRLNIKPTAFRKDQVLVSVGLGDGRLALPKDRLTESWAEEALVIGGLGKIDYDDMQQVLASHIVGARAGLTDDAFVLAGATRPQDLDTQLQVLAAYVSDPGFRPAAFARVRSAVVDELAEVDATPQGVFGHEAAWLEHDRDDRWEAPSEAQAKAGSPGALESLLKPILTAAPLEVVIVGDVQPAAVIREVAATFGALPKRPAPEPVPAADLAVRFPTGGAPPVVLTHKGRADQAIAYEAWPTDGLFADPQQSRAVNVAAAVLENRLIDKVRIAEGASYSPTAAANPSDVFPTYGVAYASVETPPAKIADFYKTVDQITADLAARGPTADELARAVRPRIETLAKAQQTNEYWLSWVAGADRDPRRLDIVRQTLPGYARVTAADVRKAAAYFNDAKAWRLEVTPASQSTSASVPAAAPAAH
jgi:zinc protease